MVILKISFPFFTVRFLLILMICGNTFGSDLKGISLSAAVPDVRPWGWSEHENLAAIYGEFALNILDTAGFTSSDNDTYPFARVLSRLRSGQADFAIFNKQIAELDPDIEPITFVAKMDYVLFYKVENAERLKTWQDFENHIVAIINGGLYLPEFDNDDKYKKHKASDYRQMVKLLERDRVDGILELYDSLLVEFRKQGLDQNDYLFHHISVNEMWLVYSKKNLQRDIDKGVIEHLKDSIKELHEGEVFKRILLEHL